MTCTEETVTSNYDYTYLYFPEFLEFIGRSAWLKYMDTYQHESWVLTKKIKVVLTEMFKITGDIVLEPPKLREVISDSDDEY